MSFEIQTIWCAHLLSRDSSQQLAPILAQQSVAVGWDERNSAPSSRGLYAIAVEFDQSCIQLSSIVPTTLRGVWR